MKISTDFHSHILPGADHGSDGVETSRGQLDLIARYGIKRVVATPHFYPSEDNLETFLYRREKCALALAGAMREGDPQVLLGAEVLICEGIDRMLGLEKLAVSGTKCLLLEMPLSRWSSSLYETVEAIADEGFDVVMAHIDRYDHRQIDRLMQLDVSAQLNPGTFSTRRGRKFAAKWLDAGKVVALGSDLHRVNEAEYRDFSAAAEALGEYADTVEESMTSLLSGAKTMEFGKDPSGIFD